HCARTLCQQAGAGGHTRARGGGRARRAFHRGAGARPRRKRQRSEPRRTRQFLLARMNPFPEHCMSPSAPSEARPPSRWYREPWPWFLMAGPFLAMLGCVITIYLAVTRFDGQAIADGAVKRGLLV